MLTRNNGYLDLDEYFSQSFRVIKNSSIFRQFYYQYTNHEHLDINLKIKDSFYLKIGGEWYFLKQTSFPGVEMIVDEFLKLLGLDHHEYDAVKLNRKRYSISKSYLKEKMHSLYGTEVLNRFCESVPHLYFEELGFNRTFYYDYDKTPFEKTNTLALIEPAFAELLKNVPNNQMIIEELMRKFSIHYVLSILLTNGDFSTFNWQIVECDGNYDLIFLDNARCFEKSEYPVKLGADVKDVYDKLTFFDSLENFFKTASLANVSAAKELILKATPELFAMAIKNYENKVQNSIELCQYNKEILQTYAENYKAALDILKNQKLLKTPE